jgi:hypothetical protein
MDFKPVNWLSSVNVLRIHGSSWLVPGNYFETGQSNFLSYPYQLTVLHYHAVCNLMNSTAGTAKLNKQQNLQKLNLYSIVCAVSH